MEVEDTSNIWKELDIVIILWTILAMTKVFLQIILMIFALMKFAKKNQRKYWKGLEIVIILWTILAMTKVFLQIILMIFALMEFAKKNQRKYHLPS